jgi:hypothetical protein
MPSLICLGISIADNMEGRMPWKIGSVQSTDWNGQIGPGFTLGMEGRSPTLSMIFRDQAEAQKAREDLQAIVDRALAIVPASGR